MTEFPGTGAGGMPESRAGILHYLKRQGEATRTELARHLGHTTEAIRQHLLVLERQGWIAREKHPGTGTRGRPRLLYRLTEAGDHLFPKHYDAITIELIDTLAESAGGTALQGMLAALTDRQVARWRGELEGLRLGEKLERLKGIYFEDDPYTRIERDERGYVLIERNCPFLNVALERPTLCSVTVSTLSRLLGVKVVREARFQDGDRHCAFRVLADEPVDERFRFELEPETR